VRSLGSFDSEEVKDSNGELGELAILDELAEVGEGWETRGNEGEKEGGRIRESQLVVFENEQTWRGIKIRVETLEKSESNSPVSLQSLMNLIISKIASTMVLLKSYPPSSRSMLDRNVNMAACF